MSKWIERLEQSIFNEELVVDRKALRYLRCLPPKVIVSSTLHNQANILLSSKIFTCLDMDSLRRIDDIFREML